MGGSGSVYEDVIAEAGGEHTVTGGPRMAGDHVCVEPVVIGDRQDPVAEQVQKRVDLGHGGPEVDDGSHEQETRDGSGGRCAGGI
jgi:hypothetical protein